MEAAAAGSMMRSFPSYSSSSVSSSASATLIPKSQKTHFSCFLFCSASLSSNYYYPTRSKSRSRRMLLLLAASPTNTDNNIISLSSSTGRSTLIPAKCLSSTNTTTSTSTTPLTINLDNFKTTFNDDSSSSSSSSVKEMMLPKIDKSGRFCSPRAARELALMILYAACLEGSDPVRLFDKRLNARRETGYEFDKASLMEYDHMSFGGPPVTVQTAEEEDEILQIDQKESDIEAAVLSAPPKLVYSKLILRFTRKLLLAVVEKWDSNVLAIDKVVPPNWKNEPAGRILELSVLHLAMSEIAVLGTRHQIVINEAVDLAKRFCDGAAPRIVNGCLRTYIKERSGDGEARHLKIKQTV